MINIIIPLGGKGERFSKCGYILPKPLIKVLGKEIICWNLDHLDFEYVNQIYIPYHFSLGNYRFEELLRSKYPKLSFVFYCLPKETKGASESIYLILNQVETKERDLPFLCIDGDNFYLSNIIQIYQNSLNKNLVISIEDNSESECFSFLRKDSNNQILEIKEKKRISDIISIGCYGFENGHILYNTSKKIIEDSKYHHNNESYTSGIIQSLIDDGNIFQNINISRNNWVCLGTPLQIKMFCNNLPKHQAIKTAIDLKIPTYRFCFDLDNTLVTFPKIPGDYTSVDPIYSTISILKYLKKMGHTIIIYTARRMKTHSGDLGKVVKDIGKVTFETLEKFDIPYDEIIFGKPYAHFYIDDLGINSYSNLEKELGFYENSILPRDFHQIKSSTDSITKKGKNLNNEIEWYLKMPKQIKDIFPILIRYDNEGKWYEMEKIYGLSISKLYIDQELTKDTFQSILETLERIHNVPIDKNENNDICIYSSYINKIQMRYSNYDYSIFSKSKDYIDFFSNKFLEYKSKNLGKKTIIHGDPVFTNILINYYGKIKMIDMRGKLTTTKDGKYLEQNTIFGDQFYDYAKIYQSLICYDEILLEKQIDLKYKMEMILYFEDFINNKFGNEGIIWIKIITASLLFSLIPLHSDKMKNHKYYESMEKLILETYKQHSK
jgi:capsule biosynthesis phosphatase